MLYKIQYLIQPRMRSQSSYSASHGIVLKVLLKRGLGFPHDLRSNYSDMLQLVGSSTKQAHCYVCDSEIQAAPILYQCQSSFQHINSQTFMLYDSPHMHIKMKATVELLTMSKNAWWNSEFCHTDVTFMIKTGKKIRYINIWCGRSVVKLSDESTKAVIASFHMAHYTAVLWLCEIQKQLG